MRLTERRRVGRPLAAAAVLVAAALALTVWQATESAGAVSPGPSGLAMPRSAPAGWKVVFEDDFATAKTLSTRWNTYRGQPGKDPGGWWDPSHDVLADGELQLQAYADRTLCRASPGCQSYDDEIAGGLNLQLPQTYGRYLVRMRAGDAEGVSIVALLWPSTGSAPPEIDFAEDNGASPRTLDTATFHYGSPEISIHRTLAVNMAKWHTYGVVWQPGRIIYTIDGRRWASVRSSAVPSVPMILAIQDQTWECGLSWEQCPGSGPAPHASLDVAWVTVDARAGRA